jgi:hypothetical protein
MRRILRASQPAAQPEAQTAAQTAAQTGEANQSHPKNLHGESPQTTG